MTAVERRLYYYLLEQSQWIVIMDVCHTVALLKQIKRDA